MKIILILIFTLIYFFNPCLADTIYLKDNNIFNGQLIKITPSVIIIEIYKDSGNTIHNISINRTDIDKIIDESEIILFEKNTQLKSELEKYYHPITSLITLLRKEPNSNIMDTLYVIPGSYKIGFIKKISPISLILEIHHKTDTIKVIQSKVGYFFIQKINGIDIRNFRNKTLKKELKRTDTYPTIAFEFGGGVAFTQLANLKNVFQNFYNSEELSTRAQDTQSAYVGWQFSLLLKFTRNTAIGAMGQLSFTSEEERYRLFLGELRQYSHFNNLRFWAGGGYGFISVKVDNTSALWEVASNGPALGLGCEIGSDTNIGLFAILRYLHFGKKQTDDLGTTNLSAFVLSLGMRFKY